MWHDAEWLSLKPNVLRHDVTSGYPQLAWELPEERVYHLCCYTCWTDPSFQIEWERQLKAKRPQDVVHHLMNEEPHLEALRRVGLAAHLISHATLIDDEQFLLRPVGDDFDAIYVARHNPQKRHELCSEIESCLFVGSAMEEWDPPGYTTSLRELCPKAQFHKEGEYTPQHEVVELMNRSRVGIAVSSEEGTMRVVTEYQLCGLPVVLCGVQDGRNEFLDPRFSRIVAPEPASVAAAVADLVSRKLPGHAIRASVLKKLTQHRRRYFDLVQSIWDGEYCQHSFERKFYAQRPQYKWRQAPEIPNVREKDVPWQVQKTPAA